MTTSTLNTPHAWRRAALPAAVLAASGALAGLTASGHGRLALAAVLGLCAAAVAVAAPRKALVGTLVYLVLLGDVRRVLIPLTGWSGQDPLLLVGPAVTGAMVVSLYATRRLRLDTPLSKATALLMGLMAAQVLNPAQGGLGVGLAGALFYIAPLLWYWVGREYADEATVGRFLARGVVPLAAATTLMVLAQAYVGFLPFQQAWIDTAGYAALFVGDTVRPFGFSTSSAECAHLLLIGVVVVWAQALRQSNAARLVPAALFAWALFLIGGRTSVVLGALALAVTWAVRGRTVKSWGPRLALAVAVGVVGVVGGLSQLADVESESARVNNVIEHQVGGLLDPTNESSSTAGLHLSMFLDGFGAAVHTPLGLGLGATTNAAGKFGGEAASSEVDLTDVILSLGLVGGLLYAAVIGLVMLTAVRVWRQTGRVVALATLGILIVCAGQWLRGGEYGTVAIVWFLIGALDRASTAQGGGAETAQPTAEPCS